MCCVYAHQPSFSGFAYSPSFIAFPAGRFINTHNGNHSTSEIIMNISKALPLKNKCEACGKEITSAEFMILRARSLLPH